MKFLSLRNVLVLVVLVAIVANVVRWRSAEAEQVKEEQKAKAEAEKSNAGANVLPSPSNLLAMGVQWKERIQALPPEERAKAQAKFDEVKVFFVQAMRLPPEERQAAVKQRLNELMNDPVMQQEWAEGRQKMLNAMTPKQREELSKKYVQYRKQVKEQQR